jgi:hypothetical protein
MSSLKSGGGDGEKSKGRARTLLTLGVWDGYIISILYLEIAHSRRRKGR